MSSAIKSKDKIALVTGASHRIGRALARRLSKDGWAVAAHCRSSVTAANDLVNEITASGGNGVVLKGDLAKIEDVQQLVGRCGEAIGHPSCLINNASEFQQDSLQSMTPEMWERHISTNLGAPIFLAQSFAEHLPDDVPGNVINIIDQRVWRLAPEDFSYTVSKAALWAATRMLAQELAPKIRVNAIGPGPILQSIHQTETDFREEWSKTLLKRSPKVDELADAVSYILNAPAMTGQMIALDSGQHLT